MAPSDRNPKLVRQLEDLIDHSSRAFWSGQGRCEHESHLPAMDMYETDEWLTIEVELPGIRREAIEVLVEGQSVFVTAMKTDTGPCCEAPGSPLSYQQVERKYGRYCREIRFPVPCNTREGRARYLNGVLILEFKKLSDRRGERRRLNVE